MNRWLREPRWRWLILALAFIGIMSVRSGSRAIWDLQSVPFAAEGSKFYAVASAYDPVYRVNKTWIGGMDKDGHPLILANDGMNWSVSYHETRLGKIDQDNPNDLTKNRPMPIRSIAVWTNPNSDKTSMFGRPDSIDGQSLNIAAVGDLGLILYYSYDWVRSSWGWNLQLRQSGGPNGICTDPNQFQDFYFKAPMIGDGPGCWPWTDSLPTAPPFRYGLTSITVTTGSSFNELGGAETIDREYLALGPWSASENRANVHFAGGLYSTPGFLVWGLAPDDILNKVKIPDPAPPHLGVDIVAAAGQRNTGWLVGRLTDGSAGKLYRYVKDGFGYFSMTDLVTSGQITAASGVAFIEEPDNSARVWIATKTGKIFRYDYPANVLTELALPPGTTELNAIAARREALSGNILRNTGLADNLLHWSVSRAEVKTAGSAGEDAGGPARRIKADWSPTIADQYFNDALRYDLYDYLGPAGTELPARSATRSDYIKYKSAVDLSGFLSLTNKGMRITGFIKAPQSGLYSFRLRYTKGAKLFLNDFSTPLVDGWSGSASSAEVSGISLDANGGWNNTGYYPLALEWWNLTASPQLILEWKRPGKIDYEPIPAYSKIDGLYYGGLRNLGNWQTAKARQFVEFPTAVGQTFHIKVKYKVDFKSDLFNEAAYNYRDPRRPISPLAGINIALSNGKKLPLLWSYENKDKRPLPPASWQTYDRVITAASSHLNLNSAGVTVECVAGYGATVRCGDITVELVTQTPASVPAQYHVWAVGNKALVALHSTDPVNGQFSTEDFSASSILNGVAANDSGQVWAIGDDATTMQDSKGNFKGWAWLGSDSGDQEAPPVNKNDALGWISFGCSNATGDNPYGLCNSSSFSYGVKSYPKPRCVKSFCTNSPAAACSSDADCSAQPADPRVGVLSGQAWFGMTDVNQTLDLGNLEPVAAGICVSNDFQIVTNQPCASNAECLTDYYCSFNTASDAYQYSNNSGLPFGNVYYPSCLASSHTCANDPSVACSVDADCPHTVSCAKNPLACRPIGWLSFDRSDTGDPPIDLFSCSGSVGNKKCANTLLACTTSADCPLARFNTATGQVEGWARFLTLKDSNQGWVSFGPSSGPDITCTALNCPAAADQYTQCRDCKFDSATAKLKCAICTAKIDSGPPPAVQAGNQCLSCGQATTCYGKCDSGDKKFNSCNQDADCSPGLCIGFGTCSNSSNSCFNDSDCSGGTCQAIGRSCPDCQICRTWGAAIDQTAMRGVGYAWSEDFGWLDMSNVKIGDTAWLQTKFGNIYSGGDIGSSTQASPPEGQFNATYLLTASGNIYNFTTALGTGRPVPEYVGAPTIPLAKQDKANILGRLDYSNIIYDVWGDGSPSVGISCVNNLCQDRVTACVPYDPPDFPVDWVNCSSESVANGKYGRVIDLYPTNNHYAGVPSSDKCKFYHADSNTDYCSDSEKASSNAIDLDGKIYFINPQTAHDQFTSIPVPPWTLGNVMFRVGQNNGAGLLVVDGDLTLNGNLTYQTDALIENDRQLPSFGAIVTGNLTIGPDVTDLHGTYYVLGKITVARSDKQLRVYGAMVAHEFSFNRQFTGNGAQVEPAELIQYDGRLVANPPPGFQDLSRALPNLRLTVP